jgi:hypothetical protein
VYTVNFETTFDTRKMNDIINKIETLEMDLRKQMATDTEKVAIDLVQTAREKAHVITGNMRNSITYRSGSEGAVKVAAEIDYAVYENARGPPHDFFDQAIAEIEPTFKATIEDGVKAVIDKKKTSSAL